MSNEKKVKIFTDGAHAGIRYAVEMFISNIPLGVKNYGIVEGFLTGEIIKDFNENYCQHEVIVNNRCQDCDFKTGE